MIYNIFRHIHNRIYATLRLCGDVGEVVLRCLRIECLIDLWGDRLDLGTKFVFDTVEVVSILKSDEVDSKT